MVSAFVGLNFMDSSDHEIRHMKIIHINLEPHDCISATMVITLYRY